MGLLDIDNKPSEFIKIIEDFAKNPKGFLLLSGKNGTGKSYSAECIMNFCARFHWDTNTLHHTEDPIFINQSDLHSKLLQTQEKYGSIEGLKPHYYNAKLVVLDDIGTRNPSEFMVDFLYAVADKRYHYRHEVGTIITTNLNSKDLREKFSDAFVSRVASGIVYRCDWDDRRFKEF